MDYILAEDWLHEDTDEGEVTDGGGSLTSQVSPPSWHRAGWSWKLSTLEKHAHFEGDRRRGSLDPNSQLCYDKIQRRNELGHPVKALSDYDSSRELAGEWIYHSTRGGVTFESKVYELLPPRRIGR
ncbi:unnamed protein product [Nezara viridula]|uniref:Uncharacterized protein n=1 Tax=Nezara viridula TaxID=85310 RepID=A0A9P0MNW5_NEZVI|nr:unnamed protein product [Nezara viridula]